MPKDERGITCLVDQGIDIFDFSLDRVGSRVPAITSAAPVVGERGEIRCQGRSKRCLVHSPGGRTGHQDDCWPLARLIECDRRAVFGDDFLHGVLSPVHYMVFPVRTWKYATTPAGNNPHRALQHCDASCRGGPYRIVTDDDPAHLRAALIYRAAA